MNKTSITDTIENLFSDFELDTNEAPKADSKPITVWIRADAKETFDMIQERSNRRFGKVLKRVIEESIKRVPIDEPGASLATSRSEWDLDES